MSRDTTPITTPNLSNKDHNVTDPEMKPYAVRLSLPLEAPSMVEAIHTFLDMANEGSWMFSVETPQGLFLVDTERNPDTGQVQVVNIIPAHTVQPADAE
jgi:hypothetical protein